MMLHHNHGIQCTIPNWTVLLLPPGSTECSPVPTEEPTQTGNCGPGSEISPGGTLHFPFHSDGAPCKLRPSPLPCPPLTVSYPRPSWRSPWPEEDCPQTWWSPYLRPRSTPSHWSISSTNCYWRPSSPRTRLSPSLRRTRGDGLTLSRSSNNIFYYFRIFAKHFHFLRAIFPFLWELEHKNQESDGKLDWRSLNKEVVSPQAENKNYYHFLDQCSFVYWIKFSQGLDLSHFVKRKGREWCEREEDCYELSGLLELHLRSLSEVKSDTVSRLRSDFQDFL